MRVLSSLRAFIDFLLPRRDRELAEEMRQHLEEKAEELVAGGMKPDDARLEARRQFGNALLLREQSQDVWGFRWLETLLQDLRYGLRQLRRNPGFTAVAIVTLALGIGATTAIFSVINAVLIRPLPFRNPGRLVQLWETEAAPGRFPLAGRDYLDWEAHNHTLQASSLYTWQQSFNASGAGEPEEVVVVSVQANFFSVLGAKPALGRTFVRGEDQAGRNHVAVVSFGFWQRHFAGQKAALGKTLELNLEKYTVVGVMPPWFRAVGVGAADLWVPLDMTIKALGQRGSHNYRAIGRLKPGVAVAQAQADLGTIAKHLETQYPDSNRKVGAAVIPLREQLVGDSQPYLLVMMGAVALVLLIACVNVANLLLARAAGRRGEIAVRHALGAAPHRIVRQLLTESVLLWLIGGSLGLAFAWAGVHALGAAETTIFPQPNPVTLDGTVLLFTLGISALAGLVFGFAPAWQVSPGRLNEELKSGAQTALTPTGKRRRLGHALVVVEIAVSLALLIGAGLLLRSFARLEEIHVGVQSKGVLTAELSLPAQRYAKPGQIHAFYQQFLDGLSHAPGVQVAAISTEMPLKAGQNGYITVPGEQNPALEKVLVEGNAISPDYFHVWGIQFLSGRNINEQDSRDAAEGLRRIDAIMMKSGKMQPLAGLEFSAVINETMAKTFWPREKALGRMFMLSGVFPVKVIGIVADVKEHVYGTVTPQAYYPATVAFNSPGSQMYISLKGGAGRDSLATTLRNKARALDPTIAVFHIRTIREIISEKTGYARSETLLLGLFALLALILTAVGIYGVMSYTVRQRTHEIAMRMALGAQKSDVLKMVIGNGIRLALVGIVIGVACALALTRLLSSLLYGVKPTDPLTFIAVSLILFAVALLACFIPARRAAKVDPMAALRYE